MATNGNENGNGPAAPMHTEAPASATVKIVSPAGFDWMLTARDVTVAGLLDKIAQMEEYLLRHDWSASGGRQVSQPNGQANQAAKTFTAEKLSISIKDGKAYYKVKGQPFVKHGVTIWEEALEASGINVEEIDPMKPPNVQGMTAHYIENENGNPKKVVKLA